MLNANALTSKDLLYKNIISNFIDQFKSEETKRTYDSIIRNFFNVNKIEEISDWKLKSIKYTHVQSWIKDMFEQGKNENTIKKNIACLKSLFDYVKEMEVVNDNPFEGKRIKRLLKLNSKKDIFEEKDILNNQEKEILLSVIGDFRDKCLITLLFYTGLRREEVVNIRWKDFYSDETGNYLIVREGKGRKDRLLYIKDSVYKMMMEYGKYKTEEDRCFKLTGDAVNKIVKKYINKAGIEKHITAHSLRHGVVTELVEKNVPREAIMNFTGHSSFNTLRRYYHNREIKLNNAGRYL